MRWPAIDWFGLRAKTNRRAGEAKAVCRLIACMENTCAIISRPIPVASPHFHGGARGVLTCVPQPREGIRPSGQDSGPILAAWHRFLDVGHVTTPHADQLTLQVAPNQRLTHNAMLLRKPLLTLCDKGETTQQEMPRLWLLHNKSTETAVSI